MDSEALRACWSEALQALGLDGRLVAATQPLLAQLLARYGEPQRHYHTLQHLGECLALFGQHRAQAQRPGEVAMALWFHDAIYDVQAHDNEQRSADWARDALLRAGVAEDAVSRIHALVMATRHDALPETRDAMLLVDIDLAILGAPPARFAEYERQIRAEYAHVPPALFEPRRCAILAHFLQRAPLYATPGLQAACEAQARFNLRAAIG